MNQDLSPDDFDLIIISLTYRIWPVWESNKGNGNHIITKGSLKIQSNYPTSKPPFISRSVLKVSVSFWTCHLSENSNITKH